MNKERLCMLPFRKIIYQWKTLILLFTGVMILQLMNTPWISTSINSNRRFSKVLRRNRLDCFKWAITSSNLEKPSEGIRRFIYDPSWCVIVVRVQPQQEYMIQSSKGANIIVLDLDDQGLMNSEFINNLPQNSPIARRNAGYLYAVANGARLILDFDDTSEMKFWIPNIWPKNKHFSINDYETPNSLNWTVLDAIQRFSNCRTYNPYKNTKDPRLNKLFRIPKNCKDHEILFNEKFTQKTTDIGSIHSIIDHIETTNVDEYPKTSPSKNITDAGKLFPKGIFIPYGTEFSLYYPLGYWSLYVPVTLEEVKGKILRSYVNKLVYDIRNIWMGYTTKKLAWTRKKNLEVEGSSFSHSDFIENLSKDLLEYKKNNEKTFGSMDAPNLILGVWNHVYKKGYITKMELDLVRQWLQTLVNLGTNGFPKMKTDKISIIPEPVTFCAKSGKSFSTLEVESKCNSLNLHKHKTFWTSDIHDGCRMDFPTILSHLKQRVYVTGKRQMISYIDLFHYPGVMFSDNRSPIMRNVNHYNFPITKKDIEVNTKYYKEHPLKDVDAFYCEFPAALCEIWMPLKKTILFLTAHRYNIGRCTKESWRKLNANLKIMKNTNNVVGALSRYDVEYMDHYSNLSPEFFPSYSGIYLKKFKYDPKYNRIIYFGHVEILDYKSPEVKRQDIISVNTFKNEVLKTEFFSTESLVQSRAIVYMAYSVMSYKLTEFYTMGIPIFLPSIKYYINVNKGFGDDRVTSTSGFYCKDSSLNDFPSNPDSSHPFNPSLIYEEDVESEVFWLQYADFYDWPYIQHFDNISHLHYLIDTVNLHEIHINMLKEVKIKRQTIFNAWCNTLMNMNLLSNKQSSEVT